jgi:hypothetical protein
MQLLSNEVKVSLGEVANVKKALVDREWATVSKDGFSLIDPAKLLEGWAQNYSHLKNLARDYYTLKSVPEVESELAKVCQERGIKYALTGFSGAARLAPAVTYQRAMIFIEDTEENIPALLELKEVPSGANVTLFKPYDEGVFYGLRPVDNIDIASPVQIYLDLVNVKGRGEEAAQALFEKVIKQAW